MSAWKNSGKTDVDYIHMLTRDALAGKPLPAKSTQGLFIFLPKGDASNDETISNAALRRPKDLRPLTLKNEDNKALAGILKCALLPTIILCASVLQRGFICGRQLLQNVVDLDYFSRVNALKYSACDFRKFQEHLDHCSLRFLNRLPVTVPFD